MSRPATTLAVFLAIAPLAQAQSKTATFFGPEQTWGDARIELQDVHGLWGGQAIYVEGSGRCVVQLVDKSLTSRVWNVKLQAREAQVIIKQAIEQDLLALEIPDRMGVPDEARHALLLVNGGEQIRELDKWENDKVQRFDLIVNALKGLMQKVQGEQPDAQGPFDPTWRPWRAIVVTVQIYSGRPDPTFELTDPAEWKTVKEKLPNVDGGGDNPQITTSRLGYSGFHLRPRQMPDFPRVTIDAEGNVNLPGGGRKDEQGLEDWLLAQARAKGIKIDHQGAR